MAKSKFFLDEEEDIKVPEPEPSKKESPKDKKYCKKCGTENTKFAKFCGNCANTEFFDTYEEYNEYANYKYCFKCEKKLNSNVKFCPDCGCGEFMHTIEEVRLSKENRVHDEWKAKVKESKDKLTALKNQLHELHIEKERMIDLIEDKKYEVEHQKHLITDQIKKAEDKNKDKARDFHNEMVSLENRITKSKTELLRLEKQIQRSKNETGNKEQEAIDLEYKIVDIEKELNSALFDMYNAQRKAMMDYFDKYYTNKNKTGSSKKDSIDEYLDATFDVSRTEGRVVIDRLKVAARNVIIPSRVSRITNTAFRVTSAEHVAYLLIPSNFKTIESSLFAKCNSLSMLVLEEGVERIEDYAFHYATIRYLYIPDSVKYIGKQAFHWWMGAVSIPKGCKYFSNSFPEQTLIITRE